MNEQSRLQSALVRDAAEGDAPSAGASPREDQDGDFPFFYANCCLGFFPVEPVGYRAFAKGQLMALAIFVPAAIGLFLFHAW